MGIYDRDYYRRERSFFDSFGVRGRVCKWLIIINVVLFGLQLIGRPARGGAVRIEQVQAPDGEIIGVPRLSEGPVTDALILDVNKVEHGEIWRLLTYAFLHEPTTIMHILFNMLFLWWFGNDVEDIYGSREFLLIYLGSAVLGGLAFVLGSMAGMPGNRCLGASGAVTTVLVLSALHFPSRIILLSFFIPVPIWVFVVFFVGKDFLAFVSHQETGTAVVVHLIGAAFAFFYFTGHWRLSGLVPDFKQWQQRRKQSRLRIYREEPAEVAVVPVPQRELDEQLEAKLDAVLEKVARFGQNSLSEHERQVLLRASEIYKKKRT